MNVFLQSNWLIAFACLACFVSMGRMEARAGRPDHGWLWALGSIGLSAVLIAGLEAGWITVLVCQFVYFFTIGGIRAMLDPPP